MTMTIPLLRKVKRKLLKMRIMTPKSERDARASLEDTDDVGGRTLRANTYEPLGTVRNSEIPNHDEDCYVNIEEIKETSRMEYVMREDDLYVDFSLK